MSDAAPAVPPLHPDLEPLRLLLGTWEGTGDGVYPTIAPFGYRETVTFGHGGKPFFVYSQRTWAADDGRPLHVETGYWRVPAPGRVELVISHPTGVTELAEGTYDWAEGGLTIAVASTAVTCSSTAKEVTALARTFHVRGADGLHRPTIDYTLRMGAVGLPLQHHLAASLRKVDGP